MHLFKIQKKRIVLIKEDIFFKPASFKNLHNCRYEFSPYSGGPFLAGTPAGVQNLPTAHFFTGYLMMV